MDILQSNILEVCNKKYHCLMKLPNVVGVGFGYKYVNYIQTNIPCIHVLVDTKVPANCLSKDILIPKRYLSITTDVVETGTFYARGLNNTVRPLQGGYGISLKDRNRANGTIGCIVEKGSISKDYYILTNNHVIVKDNSKKIREIIVQPPFDYGGTYPDKYVASLSGYVPLKFKTHLQTPTNYMDCAIAKLKDHSLKSKIISHIGNIKGIAEVTPKERIRMTGSTTGFSGGLVLTTGATVTIQYPNFDNKSAFFKNQISIAMINKGGDSGATVLNEKNEIIGLFFAGTDKQTGMCTPIKAVLDALKVQIYK